MGEIFEVIIGETTIGTNDFGDAEATMNIRINFPVTLLEQMSDSREFNKLSQKLSELLIEHFIEGDED